MKKTKKNNLWSEEEIAILKEKYPTQGSDIPELRKTRTAMSIMHKARFLKLSNPKSDIWSEEEIAILKEKYPIYGTKIPELHKTRPYYSIINKANKLGIYYNFKNYRPKKAINYWTEEELNLLITNFPSKGNNIPELRKTRSLSSIDHKASRLNLTGPKNDIWSEDEIAILKEKYPTQGSDIPELLDKRNTLAVSGKAKELNLIFQEIWPEDEIAILKEKYPTQGSDIPELLDMHTHSQIRYKAFILKIHYREHIWPEAEIAILKEKYPTQGTNIPELLDRHNAESIYHKAKSLNLYSTAIKSLNNWSNEEITILKEKYPTQGTDIPELFDRHTKIGIQGKANNLNIKYILQNERKNWSDEELAILKEKYPTQGSNITELLNHRDKLSIRNKAKRMKIHKI